MAHPETEAGDATFENLDDAAAALAELDLDQGDEPQQQQNEGDEGGEGDEPDLTDEADEEDDGDDEPATPAIDAPASLNAEEKARFAQLPEEAQRLITEVETRRNGQVQQATTKAAEAQRTAEAAAAQADAQARSRYAQQLQVFAQQIAPQAPDPMLARTDPATFIALEAEHKVALAQHEQFVQQVEAFGQQAATDLSQAEVAERDRQLLAIPEVADEATRDAFFEKAIGMATTLGLDTTALGRATAGELKALRQVHDWKDKADKYDTAMARQMQRVREGKKAVTTRPNAAQRQGSGKERSFREAKQQARESGTLEDAAKAIAKLG